jgi:hypothetical protein
VSPQAMSKAQRENFDQARIERLPLGVFRCVDALSGTEDDCENAGLWEAPLKDWYEPKCLVCMRPAVLVVPMLRLRREEAPLRWRPASAGLRCFSRRSRMSPVPTGTRKGEP